MIVKLKLKNVTSIVSSVYSKPGDYEIIDFDGSEDIPQTYVGMENVEKTYSISDLMCENSKKYFFITDTNQKSVKQWCTFLNEKGEKLQLKRGLGLSCWHDRHPFDTIPLGCPLKHVGDNVFITTGVFCSFPCMNKFLKRRRGKSKYKNSSTLMTYIYFNMTGKLDQIPYAGSWKLLKKFGGHLSIDKFRESFDKLEFITSVNNIPTMLPLSEYITEKKVVKKVYKEECRYIKDSEDEEGN